MVTAGSVAATAMWLVGSALFSWSVSTFAGGSKLDGSLGVMITRELERSEFYRERVPKLIKQLGVFAFVCFTWIFFRADSLSDAWLIIGRIFTAAWQNPYVPGLMLVLVCIVWLYQFIYESPTRRFLAMSQVRVGLAICMVLYLCLFSAGGGAFIYFQF